MAEPSQSNISAAVTILKRGGLVAFPTETVYGLGADAGSSEAVRKIFVAKGRPPANPLIVHVADVSVARRFAAHWPKEAEQLAAAFWPGPLTLVVPKREEIVAEVSAGLDSVGLRVPNHAVALRLLKEFDGPVAAPSANRSGRVSPTTADHVKKELGDNIDLILDGGPCQVGIESTVLALLHDRATILRPGGITQSQIEELIGPVNAATITNNEAARSPGMQAVHYSPLAQMFRFEASQTNQAVEWCRRNPKQKAIVLISEKKGDLARLQNATSPSITLVLMPSDPQTYAQKLYAIFHDADDCGIEAILTQMPPEHPNWTAIRDRLTRASKSI